MAANHTESLLFAKFGILSAGSSAEYFCREDSTRPHHFATGDNDDAYNLTPAFILETVAAAKGFLEGNGTKTVHNVMDKRRGLGPQISDFLAWPVMRIETALAQLHAIEEGKLSKQAVEELPTIHAATVLHRAVLRSPAKIMRMKPEPQPCSRFRRMRVTPAFLQHLPKCKKCQKVILWMVESEREAAPAKAGPCRPCR